MPKLIALVTIDRCKTPGENGPDGKPSKAPVIEKISPGTPFSAGKDEADELIAQGAAKLAGKGEDDAPKADPSKSSDGGGQGSGGSGGPAA